MAIDLTAFASEPLMLAPHYGGLASDLAREPEPLDHGIELAAIYGISPDEDADKPFAFAHGIAFIPVRGSLVNRFSWACSWITGYKAIIQMVAAAAADPDVRAVVLDVDSYGGEAAGCFETGRAIRSMLTAAGKPSVAIVDSNAYSAGYALACAADSISVIPSGGAGSVGVCTMHVDTSRANDQAGYTVTLVYAGEHKVDGNPYQPLPDSVKADMQARLEIRYSQFIEYVAEMRDGKVTADAVRATQARCYTADEALSLGLVDTVSPTQDAFNAFLQSLPAPSESGTFFLETPEMADQASAGANERARIQAILTHAEATGRGELANHLAFNTDMTAEQAQALLAVAPRATAAAPAAANPLAAAMEAVGTPGITNAASAPQDDAASATQALLQSYQLATGRK